MRSAVFAIVGRSSDPMRTGTQLGIYGDACEEPAVWQAFLLSGRGLGDQGTYDDGSEGAYESNHRAHDFRV